MVPDCCMRLEKALSVLSSAIEVGYQHLLIYCQDCEMEFSGMDEFKQAKDIYDNYAAQLKSV